MLIQMGRFLFALGVVVSVALAAKAPKFEVAMEAISFAADLPQDALVKVEVTGSDVLDEKQRAALVSDLERALETQGARVVSAEPAKDAEAKAPSHRVELQLLDAEHALIALVAPGGGGTKPVDYDLDRGWPSTLPLWGLFAGVAALGVVLWRMGASAAAKAAAGDSGESHENPFALLASVVEPARALGEEIEGLGEADVVARVDALLERYLLPLALVRQRVIDRLGMKQGSEILVTVAFGERMLNRVWSAAADGHLPEARACFPEALAALEEAARLARVALESGTGAPTGAPVAVAE